MRTALKAAVVSLPFAVVFVALRACGEGEGQRWVGRVGPVDPAVRVVVERDDLVALAPGPEWGPLLDEVALPFRDALVEEYGDLLGRPPDRRLLVVVFSRVDALREFAGGRMVHDPAAAQNLYGYTDPLVGGVFLPPEPSLQTFRHEMVHWVVAMARGALPRNSPWLGEGLAQLFEAYVPGRSPPGITPDARALLRFVLPGDTIDVERLVGIDDYGRFVSVDGRRNYLEALVLTAFLFEERERDLLSRLVREEWGGDRTGAAFRALYQPAGDAFRRDLRAYVRRLKGAG